VDGQGARRAARCDARAFRGNDRPLPPHVEMGAERIAQVNALGPLVLFQAAYPLLHASTPAPRFIAISSGAGSIAFGPMVPMDNIPCAAAAPLH
jgi:NAD(P)-dependent dehydrogenase (short-subunit alcohol dehydrogenase family)